MHQPIEHVILQFKRAEKGMRPTPCLNEPGDNQGESILAVPGAPYRLPIDDGSLLNRYSFYSGRRTLAPSTSLGTMAVSGCILSHDVVRRESRIFDAYH
jgi:hypothetical protein